MRKFISLIFAVALGASLFAAEKTYTVAGGSEIVFGKTWDPTVEANDMSLAEGTKYQLVKDGLELPAGEIAFKVCEDHAWTVAYPAQDYKFNIAESGKYNITFTFDSESKEVGASAEKVGDAVVIPTVAMHGNFLGSWADTENFALADDKLTASLKLTLKNDHYEFGLRIGGSGNWTANGTEFTRNNNSAVVTTGSGNLKLIADAAGEYTFTWTFETNTLTITFPASSGEPGDEPGDETEYLLFGSAAAMGAWQGEGAAKFVNGVVEVTIPAGECQFKVVPSDWNWDNALAFADVDAECSSEGISEGDNGNIKIIMSEEGKLRVEIKDGKLCVTFNAGSGENPQPTDKDYFLIGSAAAIGSWDGAKAVKLVNGVAEVTIPAGECQFKVVPADGANWDWNHALGAVDVNADCSSDGIKSGDNGNVKIEMAAEGSLRVELKNGKLCVTGNFVASSEPELANGYYLIGLAGWELSSINPAHKFAASDEVEGEFVLTITLAEGNTIKVVEVENDIIKAWFPEGMGTEYTVDADHMGERKIFFRPAGNPEWENFGGFIFISEEMTALENTGIEAQTVKFIRNGQLLIRANGTIMDVTGQVVR